MALAILQDKLADVIAYDPAGMALTVGAGMTVGRVLQEATLRNASVLVGPRRGVSDLACSSVCACGVEEACGGAWQC